MSARPPFLIEVRGPGASGKTTVTRRIMRRYGTPATELTLTAPLVIDTLKKGTMIWDGSGSLEPTSPEALIAAFDRMKARRRPRILGVKQAHPVPGGRPLVVLGAQGIDCGGVDTIPNMDIVYDLARESLAAGCDVIAEGRIFSLSDLARPLALRDHLVAILLTTSAEECEANTLARRASAGSETSAERLDNIRRNIAIGVKGARSGVERLAAAGVETHEADREEAVNIIARLLGVEGYPEAPWESLGLDRDVQVPERRDEPTAPATAPDRSPSKPANKIPPQLDLFSIGSAIEEIKPLQPYEFEGLSERELSEVEAALPKFIVAPLADDQPAEAPRTGFIAPAPRERLAAGRILAPRFAVLVTGPNSSGKTTAIDKATASLDRAEVRVIHADQELNAGGPEETAAALREAWCSPVPVLVVEGIDRGARAFAEVARSAVGTDDERQVIVHMTRMDRETMRLNLQRRCARRGKEFREDYWTDEKLDYEGSRRYVNIATRLFPEVGVVWWDVDTEYEATARMARVLNSAIREMLS